MSLYSSSSEEKDEDWFSDSRSSSSSTSSTFPSSEKYLKNTKSLLTPFPTGTKRFS
jgi:hypothetical protein